MVHSNSSVPMVSARGLSTQHQLDALNSAPKYFSKDQLRTANVSTGITIEYTLHGTSFVSDNGAEPSSEDRVVLIMGFLQPKESWAAVIDLLLEKYKNQSADKKKNVKILAFDNRGVGGSSAPWWRYTTSQMAQDALALMDAVGWESANIVGISMGGMISLELASIAPERVKSLSLMVTTRGKYTSDPRAATLMRKSTFSSDPVEAVTNLIEMLYPLDAIREGRMAETNASVYDTVFKYHMEKRAERVKPSIFGILGQLLAIRTHFVSDERLAGIKMSGFPVLLIGSMKDILIPPIESIILKERMDADHVHTLFFDNGGHGVTIQYIEEVSDGLVKTFQRSNL
uniref:AB hydrolase-1 domain-containing protein n=1 Tax=Globisporangium ultimum (strain ATCC 200006 / CBS 805.95 / DAOM BR144) TaxID=431595 RepID=K3W7C2_GLOUD